MSGSQSWLSLQEITDYFDVSQDMIHCWISANRVTAQNIDRRWKFDPLAVNACFHHSLEGTTRNRE
jgi:hypothetical protein